MQQLLKDLRYSLRQLRRSPGFAFTAIVTLALGIGATAAVYSVVQTVLLDPLPYPDANRIVGVAFTFPKAPPNAEQVGAAADFVREHSHAFSSMAIMDDSGARVNLSVNGRPAQQVTSLRVSEGYFQTLGVSPTLGRAFHSEEDRAGGPHVLILSHGLWERDFGGNPSIVGQAVQLNEENFTVVGVMPADFSANVETEPGVMTSPDAWQPIQLSVADPGYNGDNYMMIARLRPGLTLAQAQQQLTTLEKPFYEAHPGYLQWRGPANHLHEFRVWPLQTVTASAARLSLLTVMGATLAVLLLACLNLAGLMLARTMHRSREMAMRMALGASRARLVSLLATEGLLIAFAGGLGAIMVARATVGILFHASPLAIPAVHGGLTYGTLYAVIVILSLVATSIFSLLPSGVLLRRQSSSLRLGGNALGEALSHARVARALLVTQIALATVLVSTAAVLLGTFVRLRLLPTGIEPRQLTVFQVALEGDRYASTEHTEQFVQSVLGELAHLPGVDRAAAINGLPLDRGLNEGGNPAERPALRHIVEFRTVTPGYFATMGIPLRSGRDFTGNDRAGGDRVAIVGETAAKRWWPGRSPIGESVSTGGEKWRIVGVVGDVQMHSLVESQGIVIYAPIAQQNNRMTEVVNNWFPTTFAVRTSAKLNLAHDIRGAVAGVDPQMPVARLTTMQAVVDSTIQEPRFFSLVAAGLSVFALVLTVIGLFGLLSYQVARRTREIGVRMAMGADRGAVLRLVLRRGFVLAALGAAAGIAATWLTRPVVLHLLSNSGVDATGRGAGIILDAAPAAACTVAAIFLATLAASWLPARRAANIEPMQALRTE